MARLLALSLLAILPHALAQCEWEDHCEGDPCASYDDCDGDLACNNGLCGPVPGNTETCSWADHCIGNTCASFDDCSDDLTCDLTAGICVADGAAVPPFDVTIGCWAYTHQVPAGDGCHSNPDPNACDPVTITDNLLQVSGQHFNIGTDNIEINIFKISSGSKLLGPVDVDGLDVSGQPGGSFVKQAMVLCPTTTAQAVSVEITDLLSGVATTVTYP